MWRFVNSPVGRALRAIKQNETRVAFIGYSVQILQMARSSPCPAALAGLAGGLFAMAQEGAYIQVMSLQWSGVIVLMVLIGGGFVSFWGPVVGVVLYFVARDVLGAYTETWLLWFGLDVHAARDVQARGACLASGVTWMRHACALRRPQRYSRCARRIAPT